ncbi:hypothetical protein HBI18_139130 [Parastagonospora nodorum]|nr:hypothetical protein HBI18_139130 [Parastagonospora nodorum]
MLQTNVREGYRITTLEVIKLIEDLISYLRNAQIPKVFYEAAVKIEDLSNTLTLILSKTAQRQSSSIVSNRSTALITNKFSVASLTKLAILNNANITLVDAMHYSVVIDALIITLIKNDNDLLGTINSYIKPPLKRYKTKAVDSRYVKASRRRTKKDKDLEDSNTSSNVLRLRRRDRAAASQLKKTRDEEELAKAKKEKEKKEAQKRKTYSSDINSKNNLEDKKAITAKNLAREQKERLKLIDAYILYFKELLSDNSRIFANAIGIGKTRAIVLATKVQNAQAEGNATEYNAVNNNNKLCPTKGERTFYCANSSLENISRLTKEEAIEIRINTTNAISKALTTANKLVASQSYIILEANTPAMHSKATKHYLALLAAQFVIICSFRKIDKHVFRAYNTISVTAQRTIIRKGGPYIEKRVILLPNFLSIVQNAKQQCRDILEKEGLNKLEASRRVIFNCFKMQAIASYPALATLKAAYIKDLFTNLSKDYFLVQEAHAITKSSLNIAAEDAAKAANILPPLKEVCAKILIESYKLIIIVALIAFAEAITLIEATHVLAEIYVSIVYFNLDSELELKVLGKQDVKITS